MTFRLRGALSFAAVAVTLAGDYWIVHRPEPHGVSEFNPVKARLGKEELILTDPAASSGTSLLSHQGGKNEVVEVFFENGVLSKSTQKLLRDQPWAQSQQPGNISYTTLDTAGATGAPCRTFVDIKADGSAPSELRLFQDGIAGGEDHREFSARTNKRIQVDLLTAPDDSSQTNQPGCHKLLQSGDGQIGLTGTIPVSVLAEAGSSVRLKFLPASSTPIWKGDKGLFEPFQGIGLAAGSVRRSPIDSQQKLFLATAPAGKPALAIDGLLIGSDTLQTQLSGVGWVTVDGRPVSPTFGEWIAASRLRASLVGFANLAIFCGVIVFVAGSPKTPFRLVQWATGGTGIHVPSPARGLVVFLCHCSEDKPAVRVLDERLKADGFQPWLDEDDIFPARLWDREIKQGLQSSHAVVVCLSKTFERKEGYVQKELRFALDLAQEKLDNAVFLIPLRLEECETPPSLANLHFIDWFKPDGHERLLRALSERAKQVGIEPTAAAMLHRRADWQSARDW